MNERKEERKNIKEKGREKRDVERKKKNLEKTEKQCCTDREVKERREKQLKNNES